MITLVNNANLRVSTNSYRSDDDWEDGKFFFRGSEGGL